MCSEIKHFFFFRHWMLASIATHAESKRSNSLSRLHCLSNTDAIARDCSHATKLSKPHLWRSGSG